MSQGLVQLKGSVMGVGVEATEAGVGRRRAGQPAFGEYVEYPEAEPHEEGTPEREADRFSRRIKWPTLIALAVLEAAWLVTLSYGLFRFVL